MRPCLSLVFALFVAMALPASAGSYEDALDAAGLGHTSDLAALLARGIDPDTTDTSGNTLLILAAREGYAEVVELLLKHHARVTRHNLAGDSAIMLAALRGHREVVRRFIAEGVPLENEGWTPLMYAAFEGHSEIVSDLLAAGVKVDARAPNRATALMLAARNGHTKAVELLLVAGADPTLRNDRDQTAAEWAVEYGNTDVADLIRGFKRPAARNPG